MHADIFNKNLYLEPAGMFAQWRSSPDLPYDKERNTYALARYADVHYALRSPHLFSSAQGGRANSIPQPFMVDADDPAHRVQRAVVEKMLTPSAVSRHREYLDSVLDMAIQPLIGAGSVEIVGDIAQTLPVVFVGTILGVRPSDFPLLRRWGESMVEGADGWENVTDDVVSAVINWFEYFDDLAKSGYWDNGDGIIPLLLNAAKYGDQITYEQARGNALAILIGGNETAKYLLSGALNVFARMPRTIETYRSSPESYVNEIFRYVSPVVSSARSTTKDVVVGDEIIPAHSQVMLMLASANMDEKVFQNASSFIPTRVGAAHLSLGFGPHYCIGASLAKIQVQALLDYLINNDLYIVPDYEKPLEMKASTFLRGIRSMFAFVGRN